MATRRLTTHSCQCVGTDLDESDCIAACVPVFLLLERTKYSFDRAFFGAIWNAAISIANSLFIRGTIWVCFANRASNNGWRRDSLWDLKGSYLLPTVVLYKIHTGDLGQVGSSSLSNNSYYYRNFIRATKDDDEKRRSWGTSHTSAINWSAVSLGNRTRDGGRWARGLHPSFSARVESGDTYRYGWTLGF